jgi:hypothetical protein
VFAVIGRFYFSTPDELKKRGESNRPGGIN